jgi:hypothetical protein
VKGGEGHARKGFRRGHWEGILTGEGHVVEGLRRGMASYQGWYGRGRASSWGSVVCTHEKGALCGHLIFLCGCV